VFTLSLDRNVPSILTVRIILGGLLLGSLVLAQHPKLQMMPNSYLG
jgi:hypothetical protein